MPKFNGVFWPLLLKFWGKLGLDVCVIVKLGMVGILEVYLFSSFDFGDNGVLGGVGGWDGGLCSFFCGPNDKFSNILPVNKIKHLKIILLHTKCKNDVKI